MNAMHVTIVTILLVSLVSASPTAAEPLTLERALELAAAAHPDLTIAGAEAAAARESARQQGAWPNPAAYLELEGAPTDGDAWRSADRVLGLEQTLPWSGRRSAEREAARHLARGAAADRDRTAGAVEASVRSAFARALFARELLGLRREMIDSARRTAGIVAVRFESGDVAADEAAQARFELGLAELEVIRAEADWTSVKADLAAAVGLAAQDLVGPEGVLGDAGDLPSLEDLLDDLDASPMLRAATARSDAGAAAVTAASRARWPDLGLSFGVRRFGGGGDAFDAGVRIDAPIFDRGGSRASAVRAEAAAADARVQLTRLDLERRVRSLHAGLEAAATTVRILEEDLMPDAESVIRAAERRFDVGDADLDDLLRARTIWIERRISALRVRLELDLARAGLAELF